MAETSKYRQFPTALPAKSKKTVTFVGADGNELEVISSISQEDLDRLEKMGYTRKSGAKAKDPDEDDEPKKAAPKKATASS